MFCRDLGLVFLVGLVQSVCAFELELQFVEALSEEGFPDLAQIVLNRTLQDYPEAERASVPLRIRIQIAEKKFTLASEQIPACENPETLWRFLAETAFAAHQLPVAQTAYQNYFKTVDEPDEQAVFHCGKLLEDCGDIAAAVKLYERAPSRPVNAQLARLLAEKDPERSIRLCEDVQLGGIDLWFGQAVVTWAEVKLGKGCKEDVQSVLETQLETLKNISEPLDASLAPFAGARYFLGLCYEQSDRPADALHQFYNVYAQYGDSPWGPKAQTRSQALIDQFKAEGKTVSIDLGGNRKKLEAGRFRIARRSFADRKYAEAVTGFLGVLNEFPECEDSVIALRELMECYIYLGDFLEVEVVGRYLGERFSEFPQAADALLAAGKEALDQQRDSLAWELYEIYLKGFPEHARAPAVLFSLAGLKPAAEREKYWLRIAAEYPESSYAVRSLGRLAWSAFDAEQYETAIARFKPYIDAESDPENRTRACFALADSYRFSSDWPAAFETFQALETSLHNTEDSFGVSEETLKFNRPFIEKTVFYQAVCLAGLDDVNSAVKTCDRFRDSYPESELAGRIAFIKGEVLFDHARYEEALAAFEPFGESETRKFLEPVLYYRGQALFETGQFEAAVESLQTLLTRWPESSFFYEAKLVQGRAFAADGRSADAVRVLGDILNYTTDDLLIHRASLELGRAQSGTAEKLASFQRVALLADPSDEAQAVLIADALFESLPLYLELNRFDDLLADSARLRAEFPAFGKTEEIHVLQQQVRRRQEEADANECK